MKRAHFGRSRIPVLAGVVLLLAVGSVTLTLGLTGSARAGTVRPAARPAPDRTVVLDCPGMSALVRPGAFILTCADGYAQLDKLTWTSWTPALASAIGSLVANDCTPTCVAGHFHRYPVLVVLWGRTPVTDVVGEQCYSRMTLIYPGSRPRHVPQTQTVPLLTSVTTPDAP